MAQGNENPERIVEKIFDTLVPGMECNIECYSDFVKQYDDAVRGINYSVPKTCAEMALKNLRTDGKNMQALDICVGTGLASQALVAHGFHGEIDGVDGNEDMLEAAREKKIFRKLLKHVVKPGTALPFSDNSYDIVVCTGAFSPGHLRPDCIPDFFRVLKSGGVFVFNTTNFSDDDSNVKDVQMDITKPVLDQLVSDGICEMVEEVDRAGFEITPAFKYYNGRMVRIHCCRKF